MSDFTCDKCSGSFASEEGLASHKKDKHPLHQEELMKKPKKKRNQILIAVMITLVIAFGMWYYYRDPQYGPDNVPRGAIHWHPHLQIIIDGKEQIIPKDIGITPTKHFPIHTHETDGFLHLENEYPALEDFYLGTFFKIWGENFSSACIFEYCTDKGELKMYVNGKENADYENYFMHEKDQIIIEYASLNKK